MKEVVLAGLLGLILSSHLGAGPLEAQAYPKVTYFDKGKSCQLKLYGIKGFIHENDYFGETVKFRKRRVDRSLETLGDCCWVLYNKRSFKGSPYVIAGNLQISRLRRLGKGRKKIRSIRKYENCEGALWNKVDLFSYMYTNSTILPQKKI